MNVVRKILCRTGRHSGPRSYPGRRCEAVRVCQACGQTDKVLRHSWSSFSYFSAGRCTQIRRCLRCGSTESRSQHMWGPWLYLNTEFNSPQVHTCRRCHLTERSSPTMR